MKLSGAKPVCVHLHDTRGMGIANASAALDAGARILDGSLGGLGGCPFAPGATGNVVFEDLAFLCESKGFATGIDIEKLVAVRAILRTEMPDETLYGGLARAGLPDGKSGAGGLSYPLQASGSSARSATPPVPWPGSRDPGGRTRNVFDDHEMFGHRDALDQRGVRGSRCHFRSRKRRLFVNLFRNKRRRPDLFLETTRIRPLPPGAASACRPSAGRCSRNPARWWV